MASSRKTPNKTLPARVGETLARCLSRGDTLTLGLSGGRDSCVLLDLLAALQSALDFRLACVHVHHGLSPHADAWAAFCERLCAGYGVPLAVEKIRIDPADARGVEAAARAARQRIFERQNGWVATAHHRDDQAETVLLQLLRGAGPKGLAAMPLLTRGSGLRLVRPLLDVPAADLADYARARELDWVEAESKRDPRFRRNALRQIILPALTAHFPHASKVLARAASVQHDAADLLDELAALDATGALHADRLDCTVLASLSPARARNLLRYFIARRGGRMPQHARLDEALAQLQHARDDRRVALRLGDGTLARYRGHAYWLPDLPAWDGELELGGAASPLTLGDSGLELSRHACTGDGLSQTRLAHAVVRVRRGGERLRLHPGGPHHSLKSLMQERAIAPWRRARLPLVFVGETLVWAAGVGSDPEWACAPGEAGWQLDWQDRLLDAEHEHGAARES